MKNRKTKSMAMIASLAIVASTFMSLPVYAEDEFLDEGVFNEEILADNMAVNEIDDAELIIDEIVTSEKSVSVTDSYSADQKAAYDKITAACDEFLNSSVTFSTNFFSTVKLDSGLTKSEIETVVSDIKASGNYPVLDKIYMFSSSGNTTYDKIAL